METKLDDKPRSRKQLPRKIRKPSKTRKAVEANLRRLKKQREKDDKEAQDALVKRLGGNPEMGDLVPVDKNGTKKSVAEIFKKCKLPLCSRLVTEQGNPPYCTLVCEMFDKKRIAEMADGKHKYKEEYATVELLAYLKKCEASHEQRFMKMEDNLIPIKNVIVPCMAGFAMHLGATKITLKWWATQHTEFNEALLTIKQAQEMFLIGKSLTGQYNPIISKLLLMNNHGMKEKSEKTVSNLFGIVRDVYRKADMLELMEGDTALDNENEDDTISS